MKLILLIILSTIWLVPIYLSASSYLTWVSNELAPRLDGAKPANSFPYIHFAQQMLALGLILLAAAIGAWTYLLVGKKLG